MKFKSKIPKNVDPIELADEIKRGMAKEFLRNRLEFKKTNELMKKRTILKSEAIIVADSVKSGISIKVMNDLEELRHARSKALTAWQS